MELRFIFCQRSHGSSGLRSFVQNNYSALKAANPSLPILIRESEGTAPRITARFDYGKEDTYFVDGATDLEINHKFKQLTDA